MNVEHTHNIGKLMLAFICFWTYIAFSQLLLIWIAGLPEETPFYITRFNPGWRVGRHRPHLRPLLRPVRRAAVALAQAEPAAAGGWSAIWILLIHYIDIYWLVMPTLYPEGVRVPLDAATAFLGVGLVAVAFGVSRLRGQLPVPVQ